MSDIWTQDEGRFWTEASTLEHSNEKGICPHCHQKNALWEDTSKFAHGYETVQGELLAIHAKCIECGIKVTVFND
jgi:hypothetical protein